MKVVGFKSIIKNKLGNLDQGISSVGDTFQYTKYNPLADYSDASCFIQFNIYNPYLEYNRQIKKDSFKYILDSQKPFLVGEEGAFRQFSDYKRFGWYSYKDNVGLFHRGEIDSARWAKFSKDTGLVIKDWNSPGDNILIMGQLEHDSALIELYDQGYTSFVEYIIEKIYEIRKYTDRPIVVRPHPKDIYSFESAIATLDKIKNVSVSKNFSNDSFFSGGSGLQEDFNNAYCVVTYSSNSGVEAVCQGIPIYTLSAASAAYDVAHTDLSKIENLSYDIDITPWCNKIAYTVWNYNEIESGEMWTYFKDVLNGHKENNSYRCSR